MNGDRFPTNGDRFTTNGRGKVKEDKSVRPDLVEGPIVGPYRIPK